MGDRVEGAVDLDRRLAFFEVDPDGEPDVIVDGDTLYVRASVLEDWEIDTPWLAVGLDDFRNLNFVTIATGLEIAPDLWEGGELFSPATALDAMSDTITEVTEVGYGTVRGVGTTRFELSIDPASAGLWTGGTTTTTVVSEPVPLSEGDLRSYRESLLDLFADGSDSGEELPAAVREALLDGDIGPLLELGEQTTGATLPSDEIESLEALLDGDPDVYFDLVEETTGTTVDPSDRAMFEAFLGLSGSEDPFEQLGGLFNALTEVSATAFVSDDGILRRLDLLVEFGAPLETATTADQEEPAFVDLSVEFWDVGEPVTHDLPATDAITPAADLPPEAIPARLSPCYLRLAD